MSWFSDLLGTSATSFRIGLSKAILSASALTAQRTFTFPDGSTELVGTDAAQTLTNKTFQNAATISGSASATLNMTESGQGADLRRWRIIVDNFAMSFEQLSDAGVVQQTLLVLDGSSGNLAGNGSGLTALNATQLTTGTVNDARLPTALAGHTLTGGSINNTPIGATTPNTAKVTTMETTGRIGIGVAPFGTIGVLYRGPITGGTTAYGIYSDATINSDVTTAGNVYLSAPGTEAASFTLALLRHFTATQAALGAGSSVTTQIGFHAAASLIGGASNYAFYGDIPAASGRWNFFANGTANNYMAGALGIGSTALANVNFRISRNLTGGVSAYSTYCDPTIQSDVTTQAAVFNSIPSTAAASFTLTSLFHYIANQGTVGAGSTITNQYGYYVGALTGAGTLNVGFYSAMTAAAGRWAFLGAGTAASRLDGPLMVNSTLYLLQPAQTTKAAAATLTIAELLTNIIQYTGAAANLTLPTGTNIDAGIDANKANNWSFDFYVINTGTGTATMVTAAGLTLTGVMTVPINTSAQFRVRRTGANTFTVYRLG